MGGPAGHPTRRAENGKKWVCGVYQQDRQDRVF